jgi:hypothetical protein
VLATPAGAEPSSQICGDVDGNGVVTDTDGVLVLLEAANLPSTCKHVVCDVNADERITDTDAVLVLRKAVGLPLDERCGLGGVSGTVVVSEVGQIATREREPNDSAAVAGTLGRLEAHGTRRVAGHVDPSADPYDGFVVAIAAPATLVVDARFPARDADLDVVIATTAGDALTCESAAPGRETCRVAVGAPAVPTSRSPPPRARPPPSTCSRSARAAATRMRGSSCRVRAPAPRWRSPPPPTSATRPTSFPAR